MHALTAAHRSLPLGTPVLVTNLDTGQEVHVTITDRGPFVDRQRRIIDLSRAAAKRLGLLRQGVGRVRVDVLEEPGPWWGRPAAPIASATLVRPPRLTEGKSAPGASRQVPAEPSAAILLASVSRSSACPTRMGRWPPHPSPGPTAGRPRPSVWPATEPSADVNPLRHGRVTC